MANWSEDAKPTYVRNLSVGDAKTGRAEIEAWFRHSKEAIRTWGRGKLRRPSTGCCATQLYIR